MVNALLIREFNFHKFCVNFLEILDLIHHYISFSVIELYRRYRTTLIANKINSGRFKHIVDMVGEYRTLSYGSVPIISPRRRPYFVFFSCCSIWCSQYLRTFPLLYFTHILLLWRYYYIHYSSLYLLALFQYLLGLSVLTMKYFCLAVSPAFLFPSAFGVT